jgi:hypothetical protein
VVASGGYPGEPKKGVLIHGLDRIECGRSCRSSTAGRARRAGDVVTSGGRVLGITALGRTVADARRQGLRGPVRRRVRGHALPQGHRGAVIDTSVVVPTLDEAETIERTLRRLRRLLPGAGAGRRERG